MAVTVLGGATLWHCVAAAGVVCGFQLLVSLGRTGGDQLQLRRKLQHSISGGLICTAHSTLLPGRVAAVGTLLASVAGLFLAHRIRLHSPAANRLWLRLFAPIMRPHEARQLPGAFWFLLGCAIVFGCFPKRIGLIAVMCLSVGDPMASLFGALFGDSNRCLPMKKSIAGLAAAFVACTGVTAVGLWSHGEWGGPCWERPVLLALAGGTTAALSEVLPSGVDDNLSMPVLTAAGLRLICWAVWPDSVLLG